MSNGGLGLATANKHQGFNLIPANTLVELVMKIRPGNPGVGIEGLLTRSAKGDAEFLNVEFTVRGGEFDKRRLWSNMTLDGETAGHVRAGVESRATLRAIFEAVNGIDPNDESPATSARRDNVTLAGLSGATFQATVEIEKGGKRPDGSGLWPDKNILGKVLRLGDRDYRRLDQPPPAPIERSVPPQPQPTASATHGSPAVAVAPIAKPTWAQ